MALLAGCVVGFVSLLWRFFYCNCNQPSPTKSTNQPWQSGKRGVTRPTDSSNEEAAPPAAKQKKAAAPPCKAKPKGRGGGMGKG